MPSRRVVPLAGSPSGRWNDSATCEWPMNETRKSVESKHSSAVRPERTYSQIGSRGEAWKSPKPSPPPSGSQREQELARVVGDHLLRPARGERRAAREVVQREHVDDREVVVAGQADRAVGLGQRDARVGLRAVADEVAEAPQLLRAGLLGSRDHRLEGVAVAVDVGADGDLHGVASIRCRIGSACLPLSSPRWWSRRRRCCSCGQRSGTRSSKRSRETTSARPSWRRRSASAPASCGCSARAAPSTWPCSPPPCGSRRATGGARSRPAPRPPSAITLASTVAALPLRAASRQRAKNVGLVTQSWGGWAVDVAKGTAIGGVFAAAGGAAARGRPAPLRPRLVGAGRGRGRGLRRRLHLPRPGRARPDLQQVHAAAGGRDARRRARPRRARRRRRGRGLLGRRVAPHDRGQRLRDRDRRARSASCSTTRC